MTRKQAAEKLIESLYKEMVEMTAIMHDMIQCGYAAPSTSYNQALARRKEAEKTYLYKIQEDQLQGIG